VLVRSIYGGDLNLAKARQESHEQGECFDEEEAILQSRLKADTEYHQYCVIILEDWPRRHVPSHAVTHHHREAATLVSTSIVVMCGDISS
jgi:hypothetical protein